MLYLWVAAQASLFFVEARRNGALELVLCTPVTVAQVLRGQWAALQRLFVIPAAVILVMAAAETMLQAQMFARANTQTSTTNMQLYAIISGITGAVEFITCLFALGWFGMWMGLTTRKNSLAVVKTIAFVVVLPLLALGILQVLIAFLSFRAKLATWAQPLIAAAFSVATDLFFIIWSRWKLRNRFRDSAARDEGAFRPRKPLPIPATGSAPPVIAE